MPLYYHKLEKNPVPAIPTTFTSNTSIPGYVCSASNEYDSSHAAYAVWKQDYTTSEWAWWPGNVSLPQWIQIEVPEAFVPTSFMVMNEIATPASMKAGIFQGSNNGSNWTDLYTISDWPSDAGYRNIMELSTNNAYKYYRLYVTDGWVSGDAVSIQAMQIFKGDTYLSQGFDTFGLPEESYNAAEAGCGRLPYTLLDYIESTGTQYIDSGIVPTTNIGMSCDFTVLTGGGGCFCGAGSDNWRWGGLQTGDTTIQVSGIMATGVTWQDYQVLTPGQRGNFKFNINADRKAFYNNTEIRNSIPTGSTTTTGTIFVFAYNYNGTGEPWRIVYNGRIHSLTLFDGITVVRDFIPVLTLQGVPCMYDKVSKQFFYNQGTGTFLYGELS